jgi:hypothetical protein
MNGLRAESKKVKACLIMSPVARFSISTWTFRAYIILDAALPPREPGMVSLLICWLRSFYFCL